MIRPILGLLLLSLFSVSFALLLPKSKNMGRLEKYDKIETAKGYKTKITFIANSDCMINGKLNYKEVETIDSDPAKNEHDFPKLRLVNLYVKANQDCNPKSKMVTTKQTYIVNADSERLTKIFLTYEDAVQVEKIESEKD